MTLGIDQSTAGRRLAALETVLDTPLFRRSRQGMMPTEAGEILIARAAEIESQTLRIADAVNPGNRSAQGIVRVVGNQWIIDLLTRGGLGAFVRDRPGIALRVTTGRPNSSLWRGEPGLALWFEQEPLDGAFAIPLANLPYAVYRASDCQTKDWILFYDEDRTDSRFGTLVDRLKDWNERVAMTATDAGTLYSGISAGLGQGFLPCCIGDKDPRLMRVEDREKPFSRPLYLHSHPDTLNLPRVQTLMAWLRSNAEKILGATRSAT